MKFLSDHKTALTSLLFTVSILTLLMIYKGVNEGVNLDTYSSPGTDHTNSSSTTDIKTIQKAPVLYEYVKVTDSCDSAFSDTCVNVRSSPSITAPVIFQARTGLVLKVTGKVTSGGKDWYKLSFKDEWLRYPERVKSGMYISADYVTHFLDEGSIEATATSPRTNKHIVVDRSEQMLYAYDGEVLFMKEKVSTGIKATPTPRGTFTVYRKSPSRYMQGPIPGISDHYYDLPGVPWNLYFTEDGAVIHGAYWHNKFGQVWSNGCVNLPLERAEKLYKWADIGMEVVVRE